MLTPQVRSKPHYVHHFFYIFDSFRGGTLILRVSTIRRLHGQFSASVRSCGICGSFEINAAEEVNLFNLELGLLVLAKKNDKTPPAQHDLRAVALAKQKKKYRAHV